MREIDFTTFVVRYVDELLYIVAMAVYTVESRYNDAVGQQENVSEIHHYIEILLHAVPSFIVVLRCVMSDFTVHCGTH